jgi:hypothetical protein
MPKYYMQDEPEQVKPFTVRHCMLLVQLELYDNLETFFFHKINYLNDNKIFALNFKRIE